MDSYEGMAGAVDWYYQNYGVSIFNHSYSISLPDDKQGNDNGDNGYARFLDWHARTYDVVHVVAAGNYGEQGAPDQTSPVTMPADLFNGITVGAVDSNMEGRADYSSYLLGGDTGAGVDRRGKPDILAPGGSDDDSPRMSNGYFLDFGTSYAAPHVTGAAALLADPALPHHLTFGVPIGEPHHLAAKAIILNSARKRFINGPEDIHTTARDNAATANQISDSDYLNVGGGLRPNSSTGAATPKTVAWTPAEWSTNAAGTELTVTEPLDDEQGTGVLDVNRAVIQLQGGEQPGGEVSAIGWDVNTLAAADGGRDYNILDILGKTTNEFITITLVWDRVLDEVEIDDGAGDGDVESDDRYLDRPAAGNDLGVLPDFNLYLYKDAQLIAKSVASSAGLDGDNVEHLHVPVPEQGAGYRIRVELAGGMSTQQYHYGLAWWAEADTE